jgi:hypothetical protein
MESLTTMPRSNPPLQDYQRSQDKRIVPYSLDVSSSLSEVLVSSSFTPNTNHLPIALRRGKCPRAQHQIAQFESYSRVSPHLHSFACTLPSISIPSSSKQALSLFGGKHAMDEEMSILHKN